MSPKAGVVEIQVKNYPQAECPTVNLWNQPSSMLPVCGDGTGMRWSLVPPQRGNQEKQVMACSKSKASPGKCLRPKVWQFLSWFSTLPSEPSEESGSPTWRCGESLHRRLWDFCPLSRWEGGFSGLCYTQLLQLLSILMTHLQPMVVLLCGSLLLASGSQDSSPITNSVIQDS